MSRAVARFPILTPRLGAVALACASVLLASCGGGDRKSYFAPDRVIAFGDENSAFATYTSATLQDGNGNPATLKGLTYASQFIVQVQETCDNIVSPSLCSTATSNPFDGTAAVTDNIRYMFNGTQSAVTAIARDSGNNTQRTTTSLYSCDVARNWVQILASAYGKGFSDACSLDQRGGAVNYAQAGANTDQVIASISARRSELNAKTIVTVMVGQNDIVEQFQSASSTDAAAAVLRARADRMAAAIKDVIATGAKVVLALTPDISEAPIAASDRARMSALVRAYNDRLYITGLGNVSGRSLAGVNPESYTKPGTRNGNYVYDRALCDTSSTVKMPDGATPADADQLLLACTPQYFVSGGSTNTFMWADSKRAAPLLHNLIGVTVYNRAREQF